jgi:hypothetical protein
MFAVVVACLSNTDRGAINHTHNIQIFCSGYTVQIVITQMYKNLAEIFTQRIETDIDNSLNNSCYNITKTLTVLGDCPSHYVYSNSGYESGCLKFPTRFP